MNNYIEYKYRGKCLTCQDPLWTKNNLESVICKCGEASIHEGVYYNCGTLTDTEMIDYLASHNITNVIIIKI